MKYLWEWEGEKKFSANRLDREGRGRIYMTAQLISEVLQYNEYTLKVKGRHK